MFMSILFILLLFVAGLLTTNFPKKKFVAWFQSLRTDNNSSNMHAAADGKEKKIRSTATAVCSNKDELSSVFATFDKNNDGYITKQELRESFKNIGIVMEDKDIADIVKNVDSNGDGLIDLDEFCESFASLLGREEMNKELEGTEDRSCDHEEEKDKEGDLKDAFDVFDGDRDGMISVEELGLVLSSLGFREGKKLEDCKEMIRKVDMDGDGMVSFNEFKTMMKAGHRFIPVA